MKHLINQKLFVYKLQLLKGPTVIPNLNREFDELL